MTYCFSCGRQIPDDAQFCPECGVSLPGHGNPAQNPDAYLTYDRGPAQYPPQPPVYRQNYQQPPVKKKKGLLIGIVIALVLLGLVITGVGIAGMMQDKEDTKVSTTKGTKAPKETTPETISRLKRKSYTCQDLEMTVPTRMYDSSDSEFASGYTFVLDNSDFAILGLREDFVDFPDGEDTSLEEYTDFVLQANDLDCTIYRGSNGKFLYFYRDTDVNGTIYHYTIATYKGSETFWMIQCAYPDGEYEDCMPILESVHVD